MLEKSVYVSCVWKGEKNKTRPIYESVKIPNIGIGL